MTAAEVGQDGPVFKGMQIGAEGFAETGVISKSAVEPESSTYPLHPAKVDVSGAAGKGTAPKVGQSGPTGKGGHLTAYSNMSTTIYYRLYPVPNSGPLCIKEGIKTEISAKGGKLAVLNDKAPLPTPLLDWGHDSHPEKAEARIRRAGRNFLLGFSLRLHARPVFFTITKKEMRKWKEFRK